MQRSFAELAGGVAGALTLASCVPYTIAILRGRTRPSRASWAVWAAVCVGTAITYRAAGATATAPVAYVFAGYCAFVALLSIWYGEGGLGRLDLLCIFGAAAAFIPWIAFRNAPAALYLEILIDCFAFLPTLRKAFLDPAHEDRLSWIISSFAMLTNLLAVERWTPQIALYPVYCAFAVCSIAAVLCFHRVPA